MDWTTFLVTSLFNFILNSVLLLIFRSILDAAHDREMAQIEHRNHEALAQVNADLARVQMINTTRFQELHQRRAGVIADLYKLLANAEMILDAAHDWVPYIGDPDKPVLARFAESIRPMRDAVEELRRFFKQNRELLKLEHAQLMDRIIPVLTFVVSSISDRELQKYIRPPQVDLNEWADGYSSESFESAYKDFYEVYPLLRDQLESSFRQILGDDLT